MIITVQAVKRSTGWQARYVLPWGAKIRCVGYAGRREAIAAAKASIELTMGTAVGGMSGVLVDTR